MSMIVFSIPKRMQEGKRKWKRRKVRREKGKRLAPSSSTVSFFKGQ